MRWLWCVICVGCGGAPHATPVVPLAAPARPPVAKAPVATPPPKAPPLERLSRAGSLFMIVTEQGKTSCRRWLVTPGEHSFLSYGGDAIAFENHGSELTLKTRSRSNYHGGESAYCNASFEVHERADGLELGGARWFDRAEDCERALARKERVATDLSSCEFVPPVNLQDQAASQRKFEAMLRDGGIAYALLDDDCVAVHAEPYKQGKRDRLAGNLWSAVREGGRRGKSGVGYQLTPGELEMTFLGPYSEWEDGSASALGCGDISTIGYGRDSVHLGQTHYLSLASCRAALGRERERLAHLPRPADEEPRLAGTSTPALGGC